MIAIVFTAKQMSAEGCVYIQTVHGIWSREERCMYMPVYASMTIWMTTYRTCMGIGENDRSSSPKVDDFTDARYTMVRR